MPKTKRRFIDKKNAVTFHLVHRSQKDPLITDETAPQHVLLEESKQPRTPANETPEERSKRKKEEQKYGIFFDDEYDYLQHLRDREDPSAVHWEYIPPANLKNKEENGESASAATSGRQEGGEKLKLPSSVFASEFEEEEGLLRKAAPHSGPRPDLNPDIVAALDDDFNFDDPENALEDNFMELAMGAADDGSDENSCSDIDSNFDEDDQRFAFSDDEDEHDDHLGPLRGERKFSNFDNEETKSRFTEYSMSSSVIRRNKQLELLDDRFEKFFENYDEPEIGALDCEEIEGHIEMSDNLLSQCLDELKNDDSDLKYERKWDDKRVKKIMEEDSSEEEMVELEVEDDSPDKKWDCESILSTYSNAYNHPKLISEPRRPRSKIEINPKTGIPVNVFNGENSSLTLKSVARLNTESANTSNAGNAAPKSLCDQSVLSTLSVLSIRPKDETADDKKQRKRLLKEYRNERRIERKANTLAFRDEKKRQTQINLNKKDNIQGNRIL